MMMIFKDFVLFLMLLRKRFMFAKLGHVHIDIGICKKKAKLQESQKDTSVMKEIGFPLHVSHISEMLLKHLGIFASQPKELCSTPPKPICGCSCPHGALMGSRNGSTRLPG